MDYLEIIGENKLSGEIKISGAKNATLPQLIATLLTPEKCVLRNVPNLEDTNLTLSLLQTFGSNTVFKVNTTDLNHTITVDTPTLIATEANYSLVKSLRASFWVLAPLLARGRAARVALPGGDIIGARPVDIHLEALTKMGAEIKLKHGVVFATAENGLKPARIDFRFPSVGATHQILMAAVLTKGTTVITNAAMEPEVIALASQLEQMGAIIEGAGTSEIVIRGQEELGGCEFDVIGDRIEAGTYLCAAVATRGKIKANGINPEYLSAFLDTLEYMGVNVEREANSITVDASGKLRGTSVVTGPYPQYATDLQAPMMAALSTIVGDSIIEEHIFEGRFGNVSELCRMGANIRVEERAAFISGVERLSGADVEGRDIRAAASLVIAALNAEGTTRLFEVHHIKRGYDSLVQKLRGVGANLRPMIENPEDFLFAGC